MPLGDPCPGGVRMYATVRSACPWSVVMNLSTHRSPAGPGSDGKRSMSGTDRLLGKGNRHLAERLQVSDVDAGGKVNGGEARIAGNKNPQIGVDPVNRARRGERIAAFPDELLAVPGALESQHHPGLPGADGQVHRSAHGRYADAAEAPVGDIASLRDLVGAEDRDIKVTAPDDRERVAMRNV